MFLRRNHNGNLKKYLELNDHENATYENFWNTTEVESKGKFEALTSLQYNKKKH